MGVFSEVVIKCSCGGEARVQTKEGEPCQTYTIYDVPAVAALDIDGAWADCNKCGHTFRLCTQFQVFLL